jgi:hypothetical protein
MPDDDSLLSRGPVAFRTQERLAAHLYERTDPDRAAPAEHPWERSTAEERDEWWHADWGWSEDW